MNSNSDKTTKGNRATPSGNSVPFNLTQVLLLGIDLLTEAYGRRKSSLPAFAFFTTLPAFATVAVLPLIGALPATAFGPFFIVRDSAIAAFVFAFGTFATFATLPVLAATFAFIVFAGAAFGPRFAFGASSWSSSSAVARFARGAFASFAFATPAFVPFAAPL